MKIGQVAKLTGLKVDTIRFYEAEGLIDGARRTRGNYRSYEQAHVNRLSFIKQSRDLGFTLLQVRDLLRLTDDPRGSCADVDVIVLEHLAEIDHKLVALQGLRGELAKRLESCVGPLTDDCGIISRLMSKQAA